MNLLLDLETLGTKDSPAILSIGGCFFNSEVITSEFYIPVDLKSCLAAGLTIDLETVTWWLRQNEAAKNAVFGRDKRERSLKTALTLITGHIVHNGGKEQIRVWGNGAAADPVWLEQAYRKVGMEVPWKYWNVRDTRTLFSTAWGENFYMKGKKEEVMACIKRKLIPHHALDDALVETHLVLAAMKKVKVSS